MKQSMRYPAHAASPRAPSSTDAGAAVADGSAAQSPVPLLWTGGWDSTFQLLRLLFAQGREVAPFYLMDERRASTAIELATMDRIRDAIAHRDPDAGRRLLPTRTCAVSSLRPDAAIARAFDDAVRASFMGDQYGWLAAFCRQHGLSDMQLCIHRDDKAHAALEPYVTGRVERDGVRTYRVDPRYAALPQHTVFAAFAFPLFDLGKVDMAERAAANGWTELMRMTWFCHRPRRNGQPCGRCNPCLYTIDEGLGWRLPASSRAASVVERALLRPLKRAAKAALRRGR
ncbi:hypothetical protein SD81_035865 [Tolypothrix campylonemoides VB511288]|nr:hypothetical protein SD81_035865 [Tolypothrix campylonemoides VB511288]